MSLDHRLIELLLCPVCKGPLQMARRPEDGQPIELQCPADRLGFPMRDGIPVMLESEARALEPGDPSPRPPLTTPAPAP